MVADVILVLISLMVMMRVIVKVMVLVVLVLALLVALVVLMFGVCNTFGPLPSEILAWILLVVGLWCRMISWILAWIMLVDMALVPNGIENSSLDHLNGHGFGAEWHRGFWPGSSW